MSTYSVMSMQEARRIAESALSGVGLPPSRDVVAGALAKLATSKSPDTRYLAEVLEQWAERREPDYDEAEFTAEELRVAAAELEAEYAAKEAQEDYLVTVAESRRPGRPAVGGVVQIRIPSATLAEIDGAAQAEGVTRSVWIRQAIAARLHAART